MAITKTITASNGLIAKNACHKVTNVQLIGKAKLAFLVSSYENANASLPFDTKAHECAYDIEGDNPIAQGYIYLKTLPEFSDAKDC